MYVCVCVCVTLCVCDCVCMFVYVSMQVSTHHHIVDTHAHKSAVIHCLEFHTPRLISQEDAKDQEDAFVAKHYTWWETTSIKENKLKN